MSPRGRVSRLPAALLLLWVPGCVSLSGPSHVMGTEGGSLSVQCRYEEKFTEYNKYWCKDSCWLERTKIVETTESEREARSGRVSIRDRPANLTFTVTVENLTKADGGRYWCGIDRPWIELTLDLTFRVEVSVSPARKPTSSPRTSTAKTTTTTAKGPTMSAARTLNATHSANSQDEDAQQSLHEGLPGLLTLLALLLLLLAGASLLAWRMVRRRVKAAGNPAPPQGLSQAAPQSEPCYANLELLQGETTPPGQMEVVYSQVAPREDLHYTTVVFNTQNQGSEDQRPQQPETEYSVVMKT